MHGRPWKDVFLKAAYCAPNLYVLFSINGAITEVQVTFAKGTDTTHTMTDPGFWTCCW